MVTNMTQIEMLNQIAEYLDDKVKNFFIEEIKFEMDLRNNGHLKAEAKVKDFIKDTTRTFIFMENGTSLDPKEI